MEKKVFKLNDKTFKAFAYYSRGNLNHYGTLRQSLAYVIGYQSENNLIATEVVFPRQESFINSCKELGTKEYFLPRAIMILKVIICQVSFIHKLFVDSYFLIIESS